VVKNTVQFVEREHMSEARPVMQVIEARSFAVDSLKIAERAKPKAQAGEILIRVNAVSLNYSDLAVLSGTYLPDLPLPFIPASDSCGVVEEVGAGVTQFSKGDRVIPCYIQGWRDGALTAEQRFTKTLGGPLPGTLQRYLTVPAEDAVAAPAHLTDVEACTLPVAALTAWNCLQLGQIKSGDSVLVQGTGGVALFALQLAKSSGAAVIALTSTADKADFLKQLGADTVVNYRETPHWADAVKEATGGRGADLIVETVGSTLSESLSAVAFGGFIGVIGFVGGEETPLNIRQLIGPGVRLQGVIVGSRAGLESLVRAITVHRIRPVVDATFTLEETVAAFRRLGSGTHRGKIVITL